MCRSCPVALSVNRSCKTCATAADSRLMVAHARILLPIEFLKMDFLGYDTGKLCSKFGKDRSTNNVTIFSTDAGRMDGRLRDFILCPMLCVPLDNNDIRSRGVFIAAYCTRHCGGLAQLAPLVTSLVASTKLINAGPG